MASTVVTAARAEDVLALVVLAGRLPFSEVGVSGPMFLCLRSCDPSLNILVFFGTWCVSVTMCLTPSSL